MSETRTIKDATTTDGPSESKNEDSEQVLAAVSKFPVKPNISFGRQISSSSHPSLAQDLQAQLAAPDDSSTPSASTKGSQGTSFAAQTTPSAVNSAARASSPRDAASSAAAAISPGLTSRISSLSTAAGASLRDIIANSDVVRGISGSVKTEKGRNVAGTPVRAGALPPSKVATGADSAKPVAQPDAEEAGARDSIPVGVKVEPPVKQEPLDAPEVTAAGVVTECVHNTPLKTHESGAFTPTADLYYSEEAQWGHQTSAAAPKTRSSSAASSRGVRIVKEELPPGGRRSSSYLYNDWDRTLYEKTGRPPPGEAHWSRESSARHSSRSPSRPGGADTYRRSQTSSRPTTRSASARRQRSRGRGRPATSPSDRAPFDMTRCWRETQDQFGRRILYRHCFIEPEFTLRGQRIPVHGARKGSIIAAEDTYAGYALELVTPPTETTMWAQKVQRRALARKKRRRRRRRRRLSPNDKKARAECLLIEEQWQRLEEESEKLEEDRMRLQETRQQLQRLEKWWQTEGIMILQRDELRTQEESIINAAIEEECLRISEERSRIRQEWQFLLERIARQEREESRIKEEIVTLQEKQEELNQREELDMRRTNEMKAVFEIERRMMEVDRKKLVNDVLTCDTFRDALEDAELSGWGSLSDETHSRTSMCSSTREEPAQAKIGDPFVDLKDSRLERLLADVIRPQPLLEPSQPPLMSEETEPVWPSPTPTALEQRSPAPAEGDSGLPLTVEEEPARARPPRPITARGRPVKASRSTPSGDATERQLGRPLSAARSEGAGPTAPATETAGGGSEVIDVWRRRPTILQHNDASSAVLIMDKYQPNGHRGGSSTRAPSIQLAVPNDPVQDVVLAAAPAGGREHAKSEGYIDSNTRQAAEASVRRRQSAQPRLETQFGPAATSPVNKTVSPTPNVSESAIGKRTGSRDAALAHLETAPATPAVLPEGSQSTADKTDAPGGDPDVGTGAGGVVGSPWVERPSSPLRSSLRSGEAGQRHVSFHEKGSVQRQGDGGGRVQDVKDGEVGQ